jgi:predicted alpha/beta-fold hydrolase
VYKATLENEQLLARCDTITKCKYYPLWYLFNGHLQTAALAAAHEGEAFPVIGYERQVLSPPDGGIVSLDWTLPYREDGEIITWLSEIDRSKRTVLIHPGLTGNSGDHYIRSAVHSLHEAGWQAVVMNARGCGRMPLTTPKFYCLAYTDDLRYTAKYLTETCNFQSEAFMGLGFSLGANVLVKYLGEEREQTPLTVAISVGNPLDVVEYSANIDAPGFNRLVYVRSLSASLQDIIFRQTNVHEVL